MSEKICIFKNTKSTNMGFIDEFFVFPIKIYDGYSLKRAMREEEDNESSGPVPIDWIVGHVRMPGKDLHRIIWHDGFSRERKVEEVAEKGFDLTIVTSDVHGEFVCTWPRKKFEAKLDEFMEKFDARLNDQIKLPFMYIKGTDSFQAPSGESDFPISNGAAIPPEDLK